ncbi:uncharacterized protein LOC102809399 [Saccoglossus kowalevskii]|uniref:Uncharacterized protein LOC102809399 n=1 Tax=Saccoglossus kowalevskii TaxID=10224 RepID=A0ABM0M3C4_SACKO|nr:PREDICTED: uncharacterized protein LOC102809399 [Saccoglossus kowalevskii]
MSPALFSIYMDNLSVSLNSMPCGCLIGDKIINNLSYADDMCVIAPSIKGLRKMLHICELYAEEHDITYNSTKSKSMHFYGRNCMDICPPLYLYNNNVDFVDQFNYLGHKITRDLKDDADIDCQKRLFCVRANIMLRKFKNCSNEVKLLLFKTFCSSLYCCQLWCMYRKSTVNALRVSYNNAFRKLLGYARDCSASTMFVENRTNTFTSLYRKLIYAFMERLRTSNNTLVCALLNSDVKWKVYLSAALDKGSLLSLV